MPSSSFRLTAEADKDLLDSAKYTIEIWRIRQSLEYKRSLENCFHFLTENPDIGRNSSHFLPGLLRHSYKAHALFFKRVENEILIVRVLGQKMDFEEQF